MDVQALTKLLDYGLLGILLTLCIYAIVYLYKKGNEIQEKRVGDITEISKTVTIALNTVTQRVDAFDTKLDALDSTEKAILITLEKKNDKQ